MLKMKNYFIRSFFLIIVIIGLKVTAAHAQEKELLLKILTYNIHHANPPSKPTLIDLKAIAKVINEKKPDLVALQEVDVNNRRSGTELDQAAELGRLTSMNHFFVKGIDYEGGAYGIAILSKWPILSIDSLRLPMAEGSGGEPRVLAVVTVEPERGRPISFACTHLDLKEQNRILQSAAISNKLNQYKHPVILCGDFNAKPGSDVINYFDQHFTRTKVEGAAAFTIPEKNPDREIDFVMYKPKAAFKQKKHLVIQEPYASDHLPVYVELAF